jgi:ankyrin repeat protein
VLSRVGKESAGFAKATAVLLGLGGVLLGVALLPAAIASKLPLIGSKAIVSSETAAPGDSDTDVRARIDAAVREEYAAGNHSRALEIAIDEDAYETLRWLIEQGISPEMPMRARADWHQLPLVEAARRGHLETARTLLEAGANPNAVEPPESPTSPGVGALAAALMNGNCPVAQLLRDYGATVPEGLETNPCE